MKCRAFGNKKVVKMVRHTLFYDIGNCIYAKQKTNGRNNY